MADAFTDMLFTHARLRPGRLATADPDGALTWSELADAVRERAAVLPSADDLETPVAGLHRTSDSQWVVDFLAMRANGITVVCFPHAVPLTSVLGQAARLSASALIREDGKVLPCSGEPADSPWWSHAALVHLTSGTTGSALGVPRSEENLLDEAADLAAALELTPSTPVLCATPLAHSFASGLFLAALSAGAPTLAVPTLRPSDIVGLAQTYQPHVACGTPHTFRVLLRGGQSQCDVLSRIAVPMVGGAPLHTELAAQWKKSVGTALVQEFGLSEGGIATVNLRDADEKPTSVGVPLAGVAIRVVDPSGKTLGPGSEGSVVIRRRGNPERYLGTADGRRDPVPIPPGHGEVEAGDIGYMDEQGALFLTGRSKTMINVAGTKVAPRAVESALMDHPSVRDATVLGLPDDRRGELVVAVVEGDPAVVEIEELATHMRTRINPLLAPRRWLVLDRLPRTASGKPDLRAIRQLLKESDA
ncbi:fatty acid--CoA ligase family protein [Streptomyces sp. MT29]|nr:fatty acid--CoA ligase family protein [Streptomyces sp. MT29]